MAGISESAAARPAAVPAEPAVTSIEQRGIEHVPLTSRWGRPSSLFWMWAGAVWNVEFVVYGASRSCSSGCRSPRQSSSS